MGNKIDAEHVICVRGYAIYILPGYTTTWLFFEQIFALQHYLLCNHLSPDRAYKLASGLHFIDSVYPLNSKFMPF